MKYLIREEGELQKKFFPIWTLILFNILILAFTRQVHALNLTLTLQTDKSSYLTGETVNISGNVLLDGEPVNESLVAIQVNNPSAPILFRTAYIYDVQNPPVIEGDINGDGYVDIFDAVIIALAFGAQYGDPNYDLDADINKDGIIDIFDMAVVAIHYGEGQPPQTWRVEIIDVYLADSSGRPITNVQIGSLCYIWVRYRNTQTYYIDAVMTITICDSANNPIHIDWVTHNVAPGGPYTWVVPWTVPSEAELGTAQVYANAYTKLPQDQGFPHSPEKSISFTIVSSSSLQSISATSTIYTAGNYGTSFHLKNSSQTGIYSVHACAFHFTGTIALWAYNTTTFQVSP